MTPRLLYCPLHPSQNDSADDMRSVLANHTDFYEDSGVDILVKVCLSFVHSKVSLRAESDRYVWGQAKVYTRKFTNFSLISLRKILNPALCFS